jgi:hypothetical protein
VQVDGKYTWKNAEEGDKCLMETIYYNGNITEAESFQIVKDRAVI